MSFSTPTIINPVKKFYEFKSDEKRFTYYDKSTSKDVELKLPAYFIVLDQLSTIGGYSEKYKSRGYSNEVRNIKNDVLNVKTFKGDFSSTGLYDDIKDGLGNIGLRYSKSLYCWVINEKETNELINIRLTGAALTAWIDAKINTHKNVVEISNEFSIGKKGKTEYNIPVFKAHELPDNLVEEAINADKELQEFLNKKLANDKE